MFFSQTDWWQLKVLLRKEWGEACKHDLHSSHTSAHVQFVRVTGHGAGRLVLQPLHDCFPLKGVAAAAAMGRDVLRRGKAGCRG